MPNGGVDGFSHVDEFLIDSPFNYFICDLPFIISHKCLKLNPNVYHFMLSHAPSSFGRDNQFARLHRTAINSSSSHQLVTNWGSLDILCHIV